MEYNIYCDESCHLEHDNEKAMTLGAIRCPKVDRKRVCRTIRYMKKVNGIHPNCEVKWTKLSPAKVEFYKSLINYFFEEETLMFRAVVVNKDNINYNKYNFTPDQFYYRVYYQLLAFIVLPKCKNYIYLDIKDTRSAKKVRELHDCLANGQYDFDKKYIKNVQTMNSKESELIQLADILIGAIGYINRGLYNSKHSSKAKNEIIELLIEKSGYNLTASTLPTEDKFNIFKFL